MGKRRVFSNVLNVATESASLPAGVDSFAVVGPATEKDCRPYRSTQGGTAVLSVGRQISKYTQQ